jgi:hypothetical protein
VSNAVLARTPDFHAGQSDHVVPKYPSRAQCPRSSTVPLIRRPARRMAIVVPAGQDGAVASTIPGPARDLVRTITGAVDTAISGQDVAGYETVTSRLAAQPAGGRVLGDLLRALLEDTHPDGLNSDDITLVIGRCYRAAAAWLRPERVDVAVLLAVLAGALGIHEPGITEAALDLPPGDAGEYRDPDESAVVAPPAWPDYAWHAPLLAADLLPFAPATLDSYLEAAFAEYAREAREELP